MELGMIGLGKMAAKMTETLVKGGHRVVGYDLNPQSLAQIVEKGASEALEENPSMEGIAPFVPDSGEGRWTVFEAIDLNVATPIITNSLFRRISSRDEEEYADRVLSAMRHKFGGYAVQREDGR